MRWVLVIGIAVAVMGSAEAQVFKPRTGTNAPAKSTPKKDDSDSSDKPASDKKASAAPSKKATRATKKKKGKKGDDDFVEITDDD